MRKRYLAVAAAAGGGLALLVLALLLCTGGLPFFTAEGPEGAAPVPPGEMQIIECDPDELAAGGLFVLRPGADTPTDWRETLADRGITIGSPTGDGGYLVRVPPGYSAAADELPGLALAPHAPDARVSDELRAAAETPAAGTEPDQALTVTLSLFDPADKQAAADLVRRLGGSVLRGQDEPDAAALRISLPPGRLAELAAAPETLYIEEYAPPQMLNNRAAAVAGTAPLAIPGFATDTGLTGAGQIVALADSGLDNGNLQDLHPDLAGDPGKMPRVPYLRSWSGGGTADPIGHGTHMAATIVGSGAASGGQYRGVAPGAGVYFQALLNSEGQLEPPPDLTTLFGPAYAAGARLHVNGWGGQANAYRGASAQIDRFVRDHPDFLPIFGAGNAGPGAKTLTTEANSKNALVVGAAHSPRPAYDGGIHPAGDPAAFSSRGPTADGRVKPDLLAPGTAVVSARSRSGPEGMGGQPDYLRLEGTSQAAAVAGGATAVLREYFIKEEKLTQVPAALLKAALINGARSVEAGMEEAGCGLLDLTASVLSLRTESCLYQDHQEGLAQGETVTYEYNVRAPGATFRATLAWTDPAAAPGADRALVNDLDLVVRGPDGRVHRGNVGQGARTRDSVNNVEQVTIENAAPGAYTVTVSAPSVTAPAVRDSFALAQDFALVYGALPIRGVVTGYRPDTVELADGTSLTLPANVRLAAAAHDRPADEPAPGADLYYFAHAKTPELYTWVQTRQIPGITTLNVGGQTVFTALDPRQRDGGYLTDPRAVLHINGVRSSRLDAIPPGTDLTAVITPSTQNLMRVGLGFTEQWGTLAAVDTAAGTLRLLGDDVDRPVGRAVVTATDRIVDGGWADIPFGASAPAGLERLLPGTGVHLVLSPDGGAIRYIEAQRLIIMGMVQEIENGSVTLETGKQYRLFPGASVKRNGVEGSLGDLRPGDHIAAVLMAESRELLSVDAHSRVRYGQVVYRSGSSLHLLDTNNRFQTLRMDPDTAVFRWGLPVDNTVLAPGQWVRLTLDPQRDALWRVDVAEIAARDSGVVAACRPDEFRLELQDGREYQFSPRALVTKNGHPVRPADLRAGEEVEFTALTAPAPTKQVLTALTAEARPGITPPQLTVSALPLQEYLFISGRTTADRVYIARDDGSRLSIAVADGAFSVPVERRAGEDALRVTALRTEDGGVNGMEVRFPARGPENEQGFTDLTGSWAKLDIETLAGRGLLSGYPDGTFRPQQPVSRGEFTALLVRVLGWPGAAPGDFTFRDQEQISTWLAPSVAAAVSRGLVDGYPDDTFRPQALVTRAEAASMLVRALTDFAAAPEPGSLTPPPFTDWHRVPAWACDAVSRAYDVGFFRGRDSGQFAPDAPLTRAEVAAILNRYLSNAGPSTGAR